MKGKKIILAVCFAFFIMEAAALSANFDKNEFLLGDKIFVSGDCFGTTVNMTVSVEGKKILEHAGECLNRLYSFDIQTTIGQPSGKWKFVFSDEEATKTQSFFISPKHETMLLALNILAPAAETIKRNEPIEVSVQVFFNNIPFDGATLFYWLADGSKSAMVSKGQGVFSGEVTIPNDFEGAEWGLFVVAVSNEDGLRGQVKKYFSIETAEIILSVLQPASERIEAGIAQTFLVEATYFDGSPLQNGTVSIGFNDQMFEMAKVSEKQFSFQRFFGEQDIGVQKIWIEAKDSGGNTVSKELPVFVEKSFWLDLSAGLIFGSALVVIVVVAAIVWLLAKRRSSRKNLPKKITGLKKRIKELQHQYFKERKISEEEYRQRLNKLSIALSEAEKRLYKRK